MERARLRQGLTRCVSLVPIWTWTFPHVLVPSLFRGTLSMGEIPKDPAFNIIPKNSTCFIIWRVENLQLVALKREEYGKFHKGDSYIVFSASEYGKPAGMDDTPHPPKGALDIHIPLLAWIRDQHWTRRVWQPSRPWSWTTSSGAGRCSTGRRRGTRAKRFFVRTSKNWHSGRARGVRMGVEEEGGGGERTRRWERVERREVFGVERKRRGTKEQAVFSLLQDSARHGEPRGTKERERDGWEGGKGQGGRSGEEGKEW
ncbi:hypothetical protein C7M84_002398 [Penaeus vannamei]|uniref:Uncharacterized protein n=1 Tax=Penaeus vannamei TaxID=6689 RepID=A0A3R7MCD5_PENVA|nr:hypothetical protein C7M84_002398 [Penaeus vannamei]